MARGDLIACTHRDLWLQREELEARGDLDRMVRSTKPGLGISPRSLQLADWGGRERRPYSVLSEDGSFSEHGWHLEAATANKS